jgi:hypothetical protein
MYSSSSSQRLASPRKVQFKGALTNKGSQCIDPVAEPLEDVTDSRSQVTCHFASETRVKTLLLAYQVLDPEGLQPRGVS